METLEFFSTKKGLTSTSANHIANMAKEWVRTTKYALENISFYTSEVGIIGMPTKDTLSYGITPEYLKEIPEKLKQVGRANSLIAWLREAIKAREAFVKKVNALTLEDYLQIVGKTMPNYPKIEEPSKGHILTEVEYWETQGLDAYNKYLYFEAMCTALGKYIHEHGAFATAKEALISAIISPNRAVGSGRDTTIYHYEPTVDKDEVEDLFFEMQKEHREYQARLNGMKYDCESAIEASTTAVLAQYNKDLAEYNAKKATLFAEYKDKVEALTAEFQAYQHDKLLEIQSLKIAIPKDLTEIYNLIKSLGK